MAECGAQICGEGGYTIPIGVGKGEEARLHHLLKVLYISRANQGGCLRLTIAPSKVHSELRFVSHECVA